MGHTPLMKLRSYHDNWSRSDPDEVLVERVQYAESVQVRTDWKQKLDEAIGLREVVQESNKVFEMETLSMETFLVPSITAGATSPSWNHENSFTGKVTCSVPFSVFSHAPCFLWATDVPPQLLWTAATWSPLAVQKVFGLASAMIRGVSTIPRYSKLDLKQLQ
jgi:hypothetical protein